jgi:hypothetical protein
MTRTPTRNYSLSVVAACVGVLAILTLLVASALKLEVIALPREALLQYFSANPAAGYKIALNLAVIIGHRLQLFQTRWLREMQRTVEVRCA